MIKENYSNIQSDLFRLSRALESAGLYTEGVLVDSLIYKYAFLVESKKDLEVMWENYNKLIPDILKVSPNCFAKQTPEGVIIIDKSETAVKSGRQIRIPGYKDKGKIVGQMDLDYRITAPIYFPSIYLNEEQIFRGGYVRNETKREIFRLIALWFEKFHEKVKNLIYSLRQSGIHEDLALRRAEEFGFYIKELFTTFASFAKGSSIDVNQAQGIRIRLDSVRNTFLGEIEKLSPHFSFEEEQYLHNEVIPYIFERLGRIQTLASGEMRKGGIGKGSVSHKELADEIDTILRSDLSDWIRDPDEESGISPKDIFIKAIKQTPQYEKIKRQVENEVKENDIQLKIAMDLRDRNSNSVNAKRSKVESIIESIKEFNENIGIYGFTSLRIDNTVIDLVESVIRNPLILKDQVGNQLPTTEGESYSADLQGIDINEIYKLAEQDVEPLNEFKKKQVWALINSLRIRSLDKGSSETSSPSTPTSSSAESSAVTPEVEESEPEKVTRLKEKFKKFLRRSVTPSQEKNKPEENESETTASFASRVINSAFWDRSKKLIDPEKIERMTRKREQEKKRERLVDQLVNNFGLYLSHAISEIKFRKISNAIAIKQELGSIIEDQIFTKWFDDAFEKKMRELLGVSQSKAVVYIDAAMTVFDKGKIEALFRGALNS